MVRAVSLLSTLDPISVSGRLGFGELMIASARISMFNISKMGGMDREEVLAALKETGLQAASVCCHAHWVKPLSAPDEATRKIGFDGLVQSLQDAKAYGASGVLLVPGVACDGVTYQQCFDRSIVEIKKA